MSQQLSPAQNREHCWPFRDDAGSARATALIGAHSSPSLSRGQTVNTAVGTHVRLIGPVRSDCTNTQSLSRAIPFRGRNSLPAPIASWHWSGWEGLPTGPRPASLDVWFPSDKGRRVSRVSRASEDDPQGRPLGMGLLARKYRTK